MRNAFIRRSKSLGTLRNVLIFERKAQFFSMKRPVSSNHLSIVTRRHKQANSWCWWEPRFFPWEPAFRQGVTPEIFMDIQKSFARRKWRWKPAGERVHSVLTAASEATQRESLITGKSQESWIVNTPQRSSGKVQSRRQTAGEFTRDQTRQVGQRQAGLAAGNQCGEKCGRVLHEVKNDYGNECEARVYTVCWVIGDVQQLREQVSGVYW